MIGLANKPIDKTSFGSVAAQIRVAAVTFGLDPSELTTGSVGVSNLSHGG